MTKKLIIFFFISLLAHNNLFAQSKYYQDGIVLFNKLKFDEARFKFEQDIVYNPKNELSYLDKISDSSNEDSIVSSPSPEKLNKRPRFFRRSAPKKKGPRFFLGASRRNRKENKSGRKHFWRKKGPRILSRRFAPKS